MKKNQNRKQFAYILSAMLGEATVWSGFLVSLAQSAFPSLFSTLRIRVNSSIEFVDIGNIEIRFENQKSELQGGGKQ